MKINYILNAGAKIVVKYLLIFQIVFINGALSYPSDFSKICSSEEKRARYMVLTHENEITKITPQDLLATGSNPTDVDFSQVNISCLGKEVPFHMIPTRDSSLFGWSAIYFYSGSVPREYAEFTDKNAYYITFGEGNTREMKTRSVATSPGHEIAGPLSRTIKRETNQVHLEIPSDSLKAQWFWSLVFIEASQRNKKSFYLGNLPFSNNNREPTLNLRLRNITPNGKEGLLSSIIARARLNGVLIGKRPLKQKDETLNFGFESSTLVKGDNVLELEIANHSDSNVSIAVDWIEVSFSSNETNDGKLEFTFQAPASGIYEFRLFNFHSSNIEFFDITNPADPVYLEKALIEHEGTIQVAFCDSFFQNGKKRRYLIIENNKISMLYSIQREFPSTLRNRGNCFDYLLITPRKLFSSALRLTKYRKSQNFQPIVVDIQDIFDEFSFGFFSPQAIREFVKFAVNSWKKQPQYLLLAGEASWDYFNYARFNTLNAVPTHHLLANNRKKIVTDDTYFVTFKDRIPSLHLGRIPVRNSEQFDLFVDKIIQYEASSGSAPWLHNILLVADDIINFEDAAESIANCRFSHNKSISRFYLSTLLESINGIQQMGKGEIIDATKRYLSPALMEKINSGMGMIVYFGHGGIRVWGHEEVLDSRVSKRMLDLLDVAGKYPVILAFTCLNGYFDNERNIPSIAQRMIFHPQGAVAYITGVGYVSPHENRLFSEELFGILLEKKPRDWGTAITLTKEKIGQEYGLKLNCIRSFELFGDPATIIPKAIFPDP